MVPLSHVLTPVLLTSRILAEADQGDEILRLVRSQGLGILVTLGSAKTHREGENISRPGSIKQRVLQRPNQSREGWSVRDRYPDGINIWGRCRREAWSVRDRCPHGINR